MTISSRRVRPEFVLYFVSQFLVLAASLPVLTSTGEGAGIEAGEEAVTGEAAAGTGTAGTVTGAGTAEAGMGVTGAAAPS